MTEIEKKRGEIHDFLALRCPGNANFSQIDDDFLYLLYQQYDQAFFDGFLAEYPVPILKFSTRMTRVGGKFIPSSLRHEIRISIRLLFDNFGKDKAPSSINGIEAQDRLQGLQLIFEHELLHLYEYLKWGQTSCRQNRFRELANTIFGHRETRHELITRDEQISREKGLSPGIRVRVDFPEGPVEGIVYRVSRHCTVLIPHPKGKWVDREGERYRKIKASGHYLTPFNESD